jgi:hypothetical protein
MAPKKINLDSTKMIIKMAVTDINGTKSKKRSFQRKS